MGDFRLCDAVLCCSCVFVDRACTIFVVVYAAILLCYFAYSFITSNRCFRRILREICEAVFALPFANFSQRQSAWLFPLQIRKRRKKQNSVIYSARVICSIPAVIIACTALSSADDNFGRLLSGITGGFFDNFFST